MRRLRIFCNYVAASLNKALMAYDILATVILRQNNDVIPVKAGILAKASLLTLEIFICDAAK